MTIARQSLKITLSERLKGNPEWKPVLSDYLSRMMDGQFPIMDIFGQLFWKQKLELIDAMVFSDLYCSLHQGDLLLAKVKVGRGPYKNRDIGKNQDCLNQLPYPFFGEFAGEVGLLADNDGAFWWTSDIVVDVMLSSGELLEKTLSPSQYPLEVGTTTFEKTLYHLKSCGGLARWPYGDEFITLMHYQCQSHFDAILPPPLIEEEEESKPFWITPKYEPIIVQDGKQLRNELIKSDMRDVALRRQENHKRKLKAKRSRSAGMRNVESDRRKKEVEQMKKHCKLNGSKEWWGI